MTKSKRKVGVAHPRLCRGGSEARVMWAIEALKDDHDVSVITTGVVDLEALNSYYGTAVRREDITVLQTPMPWFLQHTNGAAALRGAYYQRFCREIASQFDVLISAYNLCDFGKPAIQFIADFSWDDDIRRGLHPASPGVRGSFYGDSLLRQAYLKIVGMKWNPAERTLDGDDLIVANSKWSADMIAARYGRTVQVVYPPVADFFPVMEGSDKETGFVCIGRLAPEKRIERIIEILRLVRQSGHEVHLHIIGAAEDRSYGRLIKKICRNEGGWINLEGLRQGMEKKALLSRHRFGIHACEGEAFGIAVAEMVKAGCITFAPDRGGQAEIVNHPQLVYDRIDDAVDKINSVLRNKQLQAELADHLARQSDKFSCIKFMKEVRAAVNIFPAAGRSAGISERVVAL